MAVRLSAALVALALLVFVPSALADSAASTNWAGYAVHRPRLSFRTVEGGWRQPGVVCHPGLRTFSSYWVGLGGFSESSQAIEQIGTEADCTRNGRLASTAWYELLPAPSVPISLPIHPGDLMRAGVAVSGHAVFFTLEDVTTRHGFSRTVPAPDVDLSSAEWILEAPSNCLSLTDCMTLPLADFHSATFTGAVAETARGHWGTISDPRWDTTRIALDPGAGAGVSASRAGSGLLGAVPGLLTATGSAFTVQRAAINLAAGTGAAPVAGSSAPAAANPLGAIQLRPEIR